MIVAAVLIIASIVYYKLGKTLNIVDHPNFRSSHKIPTVRGGGVLFYLAILTYWVSSNFQFHLFFIGVSFIAIISFLDDIYSLSVKQRLPFHFLGIVLMLLEMDFLKSWYLLLIVLVFIGVLFINLYNFIDGINGMISISSIIILSSLLYINSQNDVINENILIYPIISLIIFSFYNFRKKALFFGGDVGSLTMGCLVFFCLMKFSFSLKSPLIFLLAAVYICDTGLTILVRILRKEKVFQPHRNHIYEQLVDFSPFGHLQISSFYGLVQLLVNLVVINFYGSDLSMQIVFILIILSLLTILYFVMLNILKKMQSSKK
jgi:UDP-N-acetylmuramyl pentapeptide phosphotransferase/UDP-N-acetylglucosamine-1-phosphate transferase